MRNISLLSSLLPLTVAAQTAFSYPNAIPAFGAYPVETRSYGVVSGLDQSGSGLTWDLSGAAYSVVGTTIDSVLVPSATPYSNDYPLASIAVRLVDQFGYYTADETGVLDLGYRPSAVSPSFVYSDPARIVAFPTEVGDGWSDATLSGTTATTLTVTVLAEGELRLAEGVIPDAVLVRRHYAGSSFNATSTTWFRRSDALRPLGNLLANGTVIIRAPIGLATAVGEPLDTAAVLAPNPCAGVSNILLPYKEPVNVRVIDAVGRVCMSVEERSGSVVLDLSSWPDGHYVVEITHNGKRHMHRLGLMR